MNSVGKKLASYHDPLQFLAYTIHMWVDTVLYHFLFELYVPLTWVFHPYLYVLLLWPDLGIYVMV